MEVLCLKKTSIFLWVLSWRSLIASLYCFILKRLMIMNRSYVQCHGTSTIYCSLWRRWNLESIHLKWVWFFIFLATIAWSTSKFVTKIAKKATVILDIDHFSLAHCLFRLARVKIYFDLRCALIYDTRIPITDKSYT